MPDTRISDLTAATSVAGTDVYPSVQTAGVGPVKTSLTQITAFALANAPAGAVATPSIAPTGDTNTGFWFPAADTIAASTNGQERLRINSSGNVGIGTTSPASKLDVSASNYVDPVLTISQSPITTGNKGVINFTDSAGTTGAIYSYGSAFGAGNNYALTFLTNTGSSLTEKMRITSAGNVGIGVSPSAWSAMRAVQNGSVSLATDLAVPRARVMTNTFYDGSGYKFIDASSLYANMYVQNSADGAHQWFTSTAAGTSGNTATLSELMRITSAGNVGIGEPSPPEKLTVKGNIFGYGSATGSGELNFSTSLANDANRFQLRYQSDGAGTMYILKCVDSQPLAFGTSNTERMRITSAGNILIGTTSSPTTGTQCLTIETETAPTATPADTVTFYSSDLSAGNTMPSFYTEGTIVGTGTPTADRTIAVRINGTVYYLLASTIP